jgi:hypothetical protein
MDDAYTFVDATDIRDKVKILEDTITTILHQTVECSIFIREYCGRGFGGWLHFISVLLLQKPDPGFRTSIHSDSIDSFYADQRIHQQIPRSQDLI